MEIPLPTLIQHLSRNPGHGLMPVCMGTDLVFLPRIEALYNQYGHRFLDKIMTPREKAFCLTPVSLREKIGRMGARVAVKEAVVKSLGVGVSTLGHAKGVLWSTGELLREEKQAPRLQLHHKAADIAAAFGIEDWLLSITHDGDYAMATVIGLRGFRLNETPISL